MARPDKLLPSPIEAAPLPEVINHTPWPSQYFQHVDPHGEIFHVMVTRMTYALLGMATVHNTTSSSTTHTTSSKSLITPILLPPEDQPPLADSDVCIGELNLTSVLQESDFAPYKPKCDVLLINATAYVPNGKSQARWPVGFRLGEMQKAFTVTGPRTFVRGLSTLGTIQLGEPEPVTEVALTFERAYGGPNVIADKLKLDGHAANTALSADTRKRAGQIADAQPEFYGENPIGCGRDPDTVERLKASIKEIEQQAGISLTSPSNDPTTAADDPRRAPQIEVFGEPFKGQRSYPVIGVGPLARWWLPRRALAGTHDDAWKATQWPKSPKDHDYGYWNCAPEDQQIDYPQGGEQIGLINLTPGSNTEHPVAFTLPQQDLQLLVRLHVGAMLFAPMHIDTVIIDFKAATLTVVRRALVSAGIETRKLELGTWPEGTAISEAAAGSSNTTTPQPIPPLIEKLSFNAIARTRGEAHGQ
jgi:hypothetical protein